MTSGPGIPTGGQGGAPQRQAPASHEGGGLENGGTGLGSRQEQPRPAQSPEDAAAEERERDAAATLGQEAEAAGEEAKREGRDVSQAETDGVTGGRPPAPDGTDPGAYVIGAGSVPETSDVPLQSGFPADTFQANAYPQPVRADGEADLPEEAASDLQENQPERPQPELTRVVGGQIVAPAGVTPEQRLYIYHNAMVAAAGAADQPTSQREANIQAIVDDAREQGVSLDELRTTFQQNGMSVPDVLEKQIAQQALDPAQAAAATPEPQAAPSDGSREAALGQLDQDAGPDASGSRPAPVAAPAAPPAPVSAPRPTDVLPPVTRQDVENVMSKDATGKEVFNNDKQTRLSLYNDVDRQIQDLESGRVPQDPGRLAGLHAMKRRIERDVALEVQERQADPANVQQAHEQFAQKQVDAWKEDVLEDNATYQKEKQRFDVLHTKWKDVPAADVPKDSEEYAEYVDLMKKVEQQEKVAEYDATAKQINRDTTLTPQQKEAKMTELGKKLGSYKRAQLREAALAENVQYQKLKPQVDAYDDKLREKGFSDEQIESMQGKNFNELSQAAQGAFANEGDFKRYKDSKQILRSGEKYAAAKAESQILRQTGVDSEGNEHAGKAAREEAAAKAWEKTEPGPGRFRQAWNTFSKGIDNLLGSEPRKQAFKEAVAHAAALRSNYGWRSLLPFIPASRWGEDADQVRNHRKLLRKALGAYSIRIGSWAALLFVIGCAAVFVLEPLIIAKSLEISQPFNSK